MKQSVAFVCFILTSFVVVSNSMAESATATQTISISVPEVNLLSIPETVVIELSLGDDGYYSGSGEFSYSITSNTPSGSATEKKQIMASVVAPDFGEVGSLEITMGEPSRQLTQTTVFHSGETESKTLVGNIANVVAKDIALSIALKKVSVEAVQPYIDAGTLRVAYPVGINYTLAY
jgi:hypothetical protein